MSNDLNQHERPRLAVLHRTGDVWRAVLVEDSHLTRPRIADSADLSANEPGAVDRWIEAQGADEVLCVLPASSTVCRTCALPDLEPEALEQALQLQAEAHLAEIAPPHRLGMAVLPGTPGEGARAGVILAWPESARFATPHTDTTVGFAPDIGALAALLDRQAVRDPLVWVDRSDGSLAIALPHDRGAVLRATREDPDDGSWGRTVGRALAETALNAGISTSVVEALTRNINTQVDSLNGQQSALLLSPDLAAAAAERVNGLERSAEWWSQYGVAVGAALARTGELAGLTRMRQSPPDVARGPLTAVIETLSRPKTAAWATFACILVLMFAPMVISKLRTWSIALRYPDLTSQLASVENVRKQRVMYDEFEQRAWPMTKLLSDLGANTPIGIELEFIRVSHGENFAVSGVARPEGGQSAKDLIAGMQENLQATDIFREISLNLGDADSYQNYQFDLSGRITRPVRQVRYDVERDFGKWTYEARVNNDPPPGDDRVADATGDAPDETTSETPGETAAPATAVATAARVDDAPSPEEDSGGARTARPPRTQFGGNSGGANRGDPGERATSGVAVAPSAELPQFLTQDQIQALDWTATIEHMKTVAAARKNFRGDDETKAKIEEQWQMVRAHLPNAPK